MLPRGVMFERLGVSELQERVYRALAGESDLSVPEIGAVTTLPSAPIEDALEALQESGLVSRLPGDPPRFRPAPPQLALEGLFHRRRAELEEARSAVQEFALDLERLRGMANRSSELVEIISGRETVLHHSLQIQRLAEEEVASFSKPPYASPDADDPVEQEILTTGRRMRVLYDQGALEYPGHLEAIQRDVAAGEEARVVPDLPMKLLAVDWRIAIVPLMAAGQEDVDTALLIRVPSLLAALRIVFETLWERAAVVLPDGEVDAAAASPGGAAPTAEERVLLTLMAAGYKDEAIAYRLGVGLRTVQRRIKLMMTHLGADSRYQAMYLAARKGWV